MVPLNLFDEESKVKFFQSPDFVYHNYTLEKTSYENYKFGLYEKVPKNMEIDMEILSILDSLGYPMDEIGTYLYKNVIKEALNKILSMEQQATVSTKKTPEIDELLAAMNSKYSQFYAELARNKLSIGISTFHDYIEQALAKIDPTKSDMGLLYRIYNRFFEGTKYGENAFKISTYIYSGKPKSPKKILQNKVSMYK